MKKSWRNLTIAALLGAMAYLLMYIAIPIIPIVPYMTLDFSGIPILLAFLIFHQRIEKGQRKSLLYSIGFFVIYNLMIGAREEGIETDAPVGGLVSGLLPGAVYLSIERYASKRNPKVISYIAEGIFALIFVFLLAGQTSNLPSDYTEIRNLWDEGTLEEYVQEAIAEEDVPEENTPNLIGNDKRICQ